MKMPLVFVGHGNPMNAIEDNEFSRAWAQLGRELPRPRAILCVSAHWETDGTCVTSAQMPETIHDFSGFPAELNHIQYPAPGSPALARKVMDATRYARIRHDRSWGLDHGAWSVLCRMYPRADIPVVQLSIDAGAPPYFHYELGRELAPLRKEGVLILGSGNMVHNLGVMAWQDEGFEWAVECDAAMAGLIEAGDHDALVEYEGLPHARLAIPTEEHYLPLLYVLGAMDPGEGTRFFNDRVTLGSISMRGLRTA
ncbi:4,5-DOPA-extradiol-dioxygenase [Desulfomicrobium salsuginis]